MAKRVTVLRVCVLEQEVGLWCDDCQTNGRYRFVFAVQEASVGVRTGCLECKRREAQ